MTAEVEVANSLWMILAGTWKVIATATMGIISFFTRRIVKELDETKEAVRSHEMALAAYKLYVEQHYPGKEDIKALRQEMRDGFRDLSIVIGGKK